VEPVPCLTIPIPPRPNVLPPLRAVIEAIVKSREMGALFDHTLGALEREFGIGHSMILSLDPATRRLYAVAIRGYERRGGIGAEVREGEGVIGIAAEVGCPIRIPHALSEEAGLDEPLGQAIPLPGLPSPGSQMAVPIRDGDRVTGVLYVEDAASQRFRYDDEDALAAIALTLGLAMRQLEDSVPGIPAPGAAPAEGKGAPRPLRARYYPRQSTVFVDDEYVIKGVAGAVLWKLLQAHAATGRAEFTSRELREDPSLQLPELCDNLAARLILLQRRLDERDGGLYLRKSGRGRVQLEVRRPLELLRG
jgi:adenylate cyclase